MEIAKLFNKKFARTDKKIGLSPRWELDAINLAMGVNMDPQFESTC